jgi:hypothetical protein
VIAVYFQQCSLAQEAARKENTPVFLQDDGTFVLEVLDVIFCPYRQVIGLQGVVAEPECEQLLMELWRHCAAREQQWVGVHE